MKTSQLLKSTGLLGLGVLLAGQGFAQETKTESKKDVQDTVTVWGTSVSSDTLFLGEQELALKQADHLSDLLRTLPGVDIGGTHSVNSRINIRGLDDRNLSVYIDGALQTNYIFHHIGNLLINPDVLKSADLQLGANTVTHGGIGGAVRFKTKDAKDLLADSKNNFGGRIMGSYNDNAQTGFSLTGYGKVGDRVDGLLYFNQVDRDNFKDGSGRETIGADGTTENLLAKIGYDIADNQRVFISYDLLEDSGDYTQRPDMGVLTNEAITGDILFPTDYTRETINLSYALDLGDALQFDATYYTNDISFERDETFTGGTSKDASSDNQGVNILAKSQFDLGVISNKLIYGLDFFDQKLAYDSDVQIGDNLIIKNEAQSLGLFVENEFGFNNRLYITPGVRYNEYEINYVTSGESGSWDDVTLGIAGEFVATDNFSLLASYTELFKGPEIPEPFAGGGEDKIVNPNLEPQTGDNVEFGFRFQQDVQGAHIAFGANVFQTKLEDFLGEVAVPDTTTGLVWDDNLGEIEIEGYELSASFSIEDLDLLATLSEADYDISNLNDGVTTESIREIGRTIGFEVGYEFPQHNITLNWNGQVLEDVFTAAGEDKEGYSVHNISARWDDAINVKGLSVTFGVDNLFDTEYTSQASRTGATVHPRFGALILNDVEPGRNVKVTLAKVF